MSEYIHQAIPAGSGVEMSTEMTSTAGNSKRRKKRSAPKSILKNANPNASYQHRKHLDVLMENERPIGSFHHHSLKHLSQSNRDSSSSEHNSHSHHKRRSHSSRKSNNGNNNINEVDEERGTLEKNRKNHRHHHGEESSSKSKHKHHSTDNDFSHGHPDTDGNSTIRSSNSRRHHHKKSRKHSSKNMTTEQSDHIYDQPRVPAMKYLHTSGELVDPIGRQQKSSVLELQEEIGRVCDVLAKQVHTNEDKLVVTDEDQGFYQNFPSSSGYSDVELVHYDVPCANKKVEVEEAIYMNDGCYRISTIEEVATEEVEEEKEYNVPRGKQLEDLIISQDYNVPKIRDSLSTIEEEHQDYDIPRAITGKNIKSETTEEKTEDYYKNTKSIRHGSNSNSIYANDKTFCEASQHSNDDRSSGYRSSSSPSIQSEELYANESAVVSMEDLDSCGSFNKQSLPEPTSGQVLSLIDVATETTLERKQPKNSKKNKTEEKERERAEEIEREIRKKKEEEYSKRDESTIAQFFGNREKDEEKSSIKSGLKSAFSDLISFNKSPLSPSVPKFNIPNDDFIAVGDLAGGSDCDKDVDTDTEQPEEKSKKDLSQQNVAISAISVKPSAPSYFEPIEIETCDKNKKGTLIDFELKDTSKVETGEKKKHQQKDRSVDIYHETVRQRVSRSEQNVKLAEDVFKTDANSVVNSLSIKKKSLVEKSSGKKSDMIMNAQEEDMPSVRHLRSKFELNKMHHNQVGSPGDSLNSNKRSEKKSGFLVMSSLTRRGAINVSKSLKSVKDNEVKKNVAKIEGSEECSKTLNALETNPASCQMVDEQSIFACADLKFGVSGFSKSKKNNSLSKIGPVMNKEAGLQHERQWKQSSYLKQAPDSNVAAKISNQVKTSLSQDYIPPCDRENPNISLVNDNGKWQPCGLVSKLYVLPRLADDEVVKNSAQAVHIEGLLERLPQGKKKSTLWNTWKKHYFVADKGTLQVFTEKSQTSLIERVELFSGRIRLQDDQVLGIEDRKGYYLTLKCPTDAIAQEWFIALQVHTKQDFSRTFVTPSPLSKHPSIYMQILVVDVGGASVRAGVASKLPTLPHIFFPSVMAVEQQNEQAKYFGLDAFADEVRSRASLSHPMVPSDTVDKYSVDQIALQGIFEKVFKDLALEPRQYEIQLSVPRALNDQTKQAIARMLFEEFGVSAVNMAHQSTFAFYAYNVKSGIMVDLGERMDVVPIVEGYVQAGVSRSPVGGKELRSKLQHYLLGRNYSLTSFIDSFVTRYVIENSIYMSQHFDKELDAYARDPDSFEQTLEIAPNSCIDPPVRKLRMGSERFEACEGLFKPELWGLDQAGIHVLVHKAIKECSMDARKELTQSIFLAGGLTMIPGLRERLELELERLTTIQPRVHASPYRYHAAFLGAIVHSGTNAYHKTKVSRSAWIQAGSRLDHYWTM